MTSQIQHRIQKIQNRNRDHLIQPIQSPSRRLRVIRPDRAKLDSCLELEVRPDSVYLVAKRKPLAEHPMLWRWLARFVYRQIAWSPDFGIEYIGVYQDEGEARWAASGPGMFYMELPLNCSLPDKPCQFGIHDFPLSDASQAYRHRRLPTVSRKTLMDERVAATEGLESIASQLERIYVGIIKE